ncbi:autotransporter assembly complex family protein [Marinicella sediminis]|uniref:Translocation and assembly module subunit TamA n=2 Tax=Marinicella sediminis TaxID=1792834 RepID=A0ABV7JEP3_9GAMM
MGLLQLRTGLFIGLLSWQMVAHCESVINWDINGVNDQQQSNIRLYLEGSRFDCQSIRTPNSRQRQAVRDQVRLAMQPFGYFNPDTTINSPLGSDCQPIRLTIDPGQVTLISQLNLEITGEGADLPWWQEAAKNHQLQVGKPLIQSAYEAVKKKWLNQADELFYQDAGFTVQQIRVQADTNQAAVELSFNTGIRYRLKNITIKEEPAVLDNDLLNHLLPLESGQYISRSELYDVQQKLNSSGYFNQVLFDVRQDEHFAATLDLVVMLSPAAKFDYSAGVGFSTDAGAKASFQYNNHRVNKMGHQYQLNLQGSELASDLNMSYKIPAQQNPTNQWYGLHLAYKDEETDQVSREIRKWGISETRISDNHWQNINFLDWVQESFDTGVASGKTVLYVPGTSWSLTQADDVSRPYRGYRMQAELKLASTDLLSDASFAQFTFNGKYIHGLGEAGRLLYRMQLGSTATSDFEQLPTSYRFYAGGDQSIRGFDYEQVTPRNEQGDAIGGKHLLTGSVEYEHPLAAQWAAAVFTDFGDAFSKELDFKQSVGAGIRWFSPIGPIRLDLAKSISQDNASYRLHITVGPDL